MVGAWVISVALGAGERCSPPIDEYRHVVEVASTGTARAVDSYRFGVPAGSCSHIELPHDLDGSNVEGTDLQVLDGRLLRKSQWAKGEVLVVHRERDLGRLPLSAEVLKPDFPVGLMTVEITSPAWGRMDVWASPEGTLSLDATSRTRRYQATFEGGGRLVWSTDATWWAVGDALDATFDRRIANRWSLGELGADLTTLTPAEILKRVVGAIALDPLGADWRTLRPATTVMREGRGSAAERALVLISLFRAAGYRAVPVLVRTAEQPEIPMVVPGAAVFSRIAVHVQRDDGTDIWLDPASPYSQPDSVPRELRGSIVLEPDDVPRRLFDRVVPDGVLRIDATATLQDDGSVEFTASVTAEDGATQAVRDLLGPLPKSRRQQYLSDLLRVVRPELEDLRFQIFGVEDPAYPFGMSLELDTPGALRPLGETGRLLTVPPVLGPQLARILPPNIEVVETLTVVGNDDLRLYGVRPVEDPIREETLVGRSMQVAEQRAVLTTTALRPWRGSPRDSTSTAVLDEASQRGPELLFFPVLDSAAIRALLKADSTADTRVLEALLWLRASDLPEEERLVEASRAIRKAVRSGRVPQVADAMRRYAPKGELRGWAMLWEAVERDDGRLRIVEALEAKNELREAWKRANLLVGSRDPRIRVAALEAWARTQGERPPATEDPVGHKLWRRPAALLARAEKIALEELGAVPERVDVALASRLMAEGACSEAAPRIQRAAEGSREPATLVTLEEWRACADEPPGEVDLVQAIRDSGYDAAVMRSAVHTWSARGQTRLARRWAMVAAAIEGDDVALWQEAVDASLAAGDLNSAIHAARRASDLQPEATTTGIPLAFLAALAGDWDLSRLAYRRVGYSITDVRYEFPLTFERVEAFMVPEQRLAFLRHRDDEVLADVDLLRERVELERAAGDELALFRDLLWLAREHREPAAVVELYARTADRHWTTHPLDPFRAFLRDRDVRRLTMESALVTGAHDPMTDAGYLRGDPVAELFRELRYRTRSVAEREDWPSRLDRPRIAAPPGYRSSRLLGALDGVEGYTNPALGTVLVASTAGPDRLPPPLKGAFRLGPVVDDGRLGTVFRLDDGLAPAFVARRTVDGITYWGLARSPQLARSVLEAGVGAQAFR